MSMFITCFNVIFLACLFLCFYIYLKRETIKGIWSMLTNVITFVEAYLLTKLFNLLFGFKISHLFKGIIGNALDFKEWNKTASVEDFINFFSFVFVSIFAFLLLFIILYFVNHFIKKIIFKKIYKEKYSKYHFQKNNKIVSGLVALISFITVTFAILYPFGAVVDFANTAKNHSNYEFSQDEKKVYENKILNFYSLIKSKEFFNSITYFKANNGTVKNSDEIEGMYTIVYAFINITDEKDNLKNLKQIKQSLTHTYLLPSLISEICSNAVTRFKNDQSFMGMELNLPNDESKEFYIDLLEIVSKWDKDTFIENLNTVFELYDILYSNNVLQAKTTNELINIMAKDEFSESLFLCLFKNKDLKTVLPKFINYGISSVLDSMDIKTSKDYVNDFVFENLSDEDIKKEAKIFSLIVRQFIEINSYQGKEIPNDKFEEILNNLSKIQDSKIFNNVVSSTLYELLEA